MKLPKHDDIEQRRYSGARVSALTGRRVSRRAEDATLLTEWETSLKRREATLARGWERFRTAAVCLAAAEILIRLFWR